MTYLKILVLCFSANICFASMFPVNDIEISDKTNDIELESVYKSTGSLIIELFQDQAKRENGILKLNFDFNSSKVNAYADRDEDGIWKVTFLGGLLRHKKFTKNLFIGVLCHELGHHIGGDPKKLQNSWSSVEGQADYFAGNICLKKIHDQGDIKVSLKQEGRDFIRKKCSTQFSTSKDVDDCIDSAIIFQEVAAFSHLLRNSRRGNKYTKPDIRKRSKKIVSKTSEDHPDPQCRLDTFFEGALCNISFEQGGNCPNSEDKYVGARPSCWFKEVDQLF